MVSPETRTPSLEVGAGERVKMLEVEAELSVNSESKWKVRGGSQREQRGDGRKEETGTRGWWGDGSFSERFPPSDETHAPGNRRDTSWETSARAPPGGFRRRRALPRERESAAPPSAGTGCGGVLPAGLRRSRRAPGDGNGVLQMLRPHLHFRIKRSYLGGRASDTSSCTHSRKLLEWMFNCYQK